MDTHEYVAKLQEDRRKATKNKYRGQGSPQSRLSNKQHGTDK